MWYALYIMINYGYSLKILLYVVLELLNIEDKLDPKGQLRA